MFKSLTIKKNVLSSEPMAGTVVSETIKASKLLITGYQVFWTGDPVGSFFVERSIDGLNWVDSGVSFTNPSGGAGGDFPEVVTVSPYVRLKYVHTSGTGNLTFHFAGSTRN